MSTSENDAIREQVRKTYGKIATSGGGCCGASGCCSAEGGTKADQSAKLGYSTEEMDAVPQGADLGLGCGNPQAIAGLKPGEVVLDLGSGGGFDCFLAARQVGRTGKVIGVDMTPDMVSKARENARKGEYGNVEFRLGEIENLPVADNTVDVIMSNCVINLSPDKKRVFAEAHRVLRSGGRLAVSDVVALGAMPEEIRSDLDAYCGCIAGAASVKDVERMLKEAGFASIVIDIKQESQEVIKDWLPKSGAESYVSSAIITARKP